MNDYILDNINQEAQASFDHGVSSTALYARADEQEKNDFEVTSDFTRAVASVVARLEQAA